MRRLVLFLLCLLLPVQAMAGESAPASLRLRSVQADFVQEKHLNILAHPIISKGIFLFQAPQSLRWEYKSPVHSVLLLHGGKVEKFVEREGRVEEEQGGPLTSMQVVISEISNWLDGRFTDNAMFAVSFPKKHLVLLTPKDAGLAALISRIELKLADQPGLLDEVTIFEGPGSFTRLTFSNRVLNRDIPPSRFTKR